MSTRSPRSRSICQAVYGFQIVRTASELNGITKADQDAPLLGLFDDGNMPVRSTGPAAVRQGCLQPAAKCIANPERGAEVPELAAMTQKSSADVGIEDQGHTGTQLRIAAYGPRATNVVALTDQSDPFFTMTDALGIKR